MIIFNCPQCNLELKVKTEHGGQWGNCRHCGTKLRVPLAKDADKAVGTAASVKPTEEVAFESVEGFDDLAAGIAGTYEPVEETAKEEAPTEKRRVQPKAAAAGGPKFKPIMLVFPFLLVLAGLSFYVFLVPPADESIPEIHRLPQQTLADAMAYMSDTNLFPNVQWVDARQDEGIVVIGWLPQAHIPGGEVPPKRVVNNAATIASDSIRGRATVYLVDADIATQTWRPGQPGVIDQATAEDGMVIQ